MIEKRENWIVPKGIRFLSEWKEFSLKNLPEKCILNKQLPGCGFTNYCLTSSENTILCSPRKILLKNKAENPEHAGDVFLVENKYDPNVSIDKILGKRSMASFEDRYYLLNQYRSTNPPIKGETYDDYEKRIMGIINSVKTSHYQEISNRLANYIHDRLQKNKPVKVLVTYDSFHIVLSTLKQMKLDLTNYFVVIDEMQSLGSDSVFKPEVEVNLFYYLSQMKHVCFASATPMLEEFLNMIEEFDGFPYIELDWASDDPGRIVRPDIKVRSMKSAGIAGKAVIKSYLSGDFEKTYRRNNLTGDVDVVESKEAVLYVNSVNHIIHLIKCSGLKPDQVNILCADTPSNRSRILRRLGKKFEIGSVPKKYDTNKMFTFCTRTVYIGADFYSDNARTFIFSDANIDTLAVDVGEDLAQILGRQRCEDNPWKNSATLFYIPIYDKNKKSEDIFDLLVKKKMRATENLLSVFGKGNEGEQEALADKFVDGILQANYKKDYVALKKGIPVINYFVLSNELRSFKMQQIDYKDRASVFAAVIDRLQPAGNYDADVVKNFINVYYNEKKDYYSKLKYLCEESAKIDENSFRTILDQIPDSDRIKSHYNILGATRCKYLSYNITLITKELSKLLSVHDCYSEVKKDIVKSFLVGEKYSLFYIKDTLGDIYNKYNYIKRPTAGDLKDYFEVKNCRILDSKTNKRIHGFLIVSSLCADVD